MQQVGQVSADDHCLSTGHHAPHIWGKEQHPCPGFDASDECPQPLSARNWRIAQEVRAYRLSASAQRRTTDMSEFTTETGCTVKVYPDGADTMLHFRVEDGHVARRFQKEALLVQQAFVKLDPASRAALRAALAEDTPEPNEGEKVIAEVEPLVNLLQALPQTTPRGFRYTEIPFRDYRSSPERHLSIQESSLATEHRLWVGFDTLHVDLNGDGTETLMERGHLDESTVRKLRDTLTAWLEA